MVDRGMERELMMTKDFLVKLEDTQVTMTFRKKDLCSLLTLMLRNSDSTLKSLSGVQRKSLDYFTSQIPKLEKFTTLTLKSALIKIECSVSEMELSEPSLEDMMIICIERATLTFLRIWSGGNS